MKTVLHEIAIVYGIYSSLNYWKDGKRTPLLSTRVRSIKRKSQQSCEYLRELGCDRVTCLNNVQSLVVRICGGKMNEAVRRVI
jgi:hypothetical protein